MNLIVKALKYVAMSRLAPLLVAVHLVLAVYSLAGTQPLTREFWDDFNKSAEALPIAGHAVRIPNEGPLLQIIAWSDLPSLFVFYIVNVFLQVLFPHVTIQTLSWATAACLFVITSVQWWLVGFSIEQAYRSIRKKRGALTRHRTKPCS